jgi:diguanylate cyclase (GGDEF)-like protein
MQPPPIMRFRGTHLESWSPVIWMCALALVASIISTFIDLASKDSGTALLAATLSLLLAGFLVFSRRAPHLAGGFLFVCTAAGCLLVLLPLYHQHLTALFWAYPAICISYFILGSGRASILMCGFCPAVVFSAWHWATPEHFPRIVGSLALTCICALIFSADSERQRAQMERLAARDPLTGAANRRELEKELERAVKLRARHQMPASLILFDVDHFKNINDEHGHEIGDSVLVELVAGVSCRLRKSDGFFRMGGEEFVVLLPYSRISDAYTLAEYLRNMVQASKFSGLRDITISLGIAELESDESALDWLRRADDALYRAKDLGRNQTVRASRRLVEIPAK